MSRNNHLTREVQEKICDAIRIGLFVKQAAVLGGISETTLYRWLDQGSDNPAEPEPPLQNCNPDQLRAIAELHGLEPASDKPALVKQLQAAGAGAWDEYREFREAVELADQELERDLIRAWRLTMRPLLDKDGQPTRHANHAAVSSFAARRYPERWAPPNQAVTLTGPGGGPIQVDMPEERAIADKVAAYLEGVRDATQAHTPATPTNGTSPTDPSLDGDG